MQPATKTPSLFDVILVLLASALLTTLDVILGLSFLVALGCANMKRALFFGVVWGVIAALMLYFRMPYTEQGQAYMAAGLHIFMAAARFIICFVLVVVTAFGRLKLARKKLPNGDIIDKCG